MSNSTSEQARSRERIFKAISAWPMIGLIVFVLALAVLLLLIAPGAATGILLALSIVFSAVTAVGFFIVQPNTARVLILFGHYRGSVVGEGFFWTNPFTLRKTVSMRANNLASETIKVNDLSGNPIEIGAVLVWQVTNTAQAVLDVESYRAYVDVQTETAVRQLASRYPYDDAPDDADARTTLRGDAEQVNEELQQALEQRLQRAGISVLEARISHLAYAPEIASAMLQRQQASAVIAARRLIVEGAVGMVSDALDHLAKDEIVTLDDERRASMVSNLLVVLCSGSAATPVLNTGSLYS